ncbi:MAG: PAS domain S-box protein, partial [Chloroflexota bacterium]|nr:PAS domain S-box protein [Chloroflexota bacterium]
MRAVLREWGGVRASVARAVIVTFIASVLVESLSSTFLHIPAPTVLLAVVTYAAYSGGQGPGLASALVASLYAVYFFSEPGRLLHYTGTEAVRLAWFCLTALIIAKLVGLLRRGAQASEEALRQSRDQLDAILEGVADGITVQDASGRLVYANDAGARVLGYESAEALLSSPITQVLGRFEIRDEHGELLDLDNLPGRRALRGERGSEMMLRFRNIGADQDCWSVVKAMPVFDERGQVQLAVNVFHDVTELRRSEDRIRESEERFRTTFEAAGIGMAIVGLDGYPLETNYALQRMLGYTDAELRGKVATEFTHPEDVAADTELYVQVLAGQRDYYQLEKRYIHKDGHLVWGLLTVSVVRGRDGRPAFAIAMVEDLTARKRAGERARFLTSIVESSTDAIIGKTLEGRIISWNPAAERLYGYTAEEVVGKPISILAPLERVDEIPAILERIKRGERVESLETVRISKDGRRVEVSVTISPIHGPDGRPVGASAIARDISDRRRAEEMRDLAVGAERQRIAREMHDSVAQVLGFVNTQAEAAYRLLRNGDTERATEQLSQLGKAAREVYADVREDILGLRASLGPRQDLATSLREYLPRWEDQSGIETELIVPDIERLQPLLSLETELQVLRIVQEALSNVRKHSRARHVRVHLAPECHEVLVKIEDDGTGFVPADPMENGLGHFGIPMM